MVIIAASVGLAGWAWWLAGRGRYRAALGVLTVLGLMLRLFVSSDPFLHEWDERYHALVAKNLLDDPLLFTLYDDPVLPYDYRDWSGNHVWLHKPPLTLWLIAASFKLLGVNLFALRWPSVLLSTLLVPLTYGIGRRLFNRRVAFVAAFLMSIQGLVIEMTGGRVATDHPDVHFLFWITFSVWAALQYHESKRWIWNVAAGIGLGAGILTKWLPALTVVPIWLLAARLYGRSWRNCLPALFGMLTLSAVLAVPWQWYIYTYFPREAAWEAYYNRLHLFAAVEGHEGNVFYYLDKLRIQFGELIYLPFIWMIYRFRELVRRPAWQLILTWIAIPFGFFSLVATKMPAYTLFCAPAILLVTAYTWYLLRLHWRRSRYPRFWRLVMVLLLLLPIRYSFERIKPLRMPLKAEAVYQAARARFVTYRPGEIILGEPFSIEAMFFSDCRAAYTWPPAASVVDSLRASGHAIRWVEVERE